METRGRKRDQGNHRPMKPVEPRWDRGLPSDNAWPCVFVRRKILASELEYRCISPYEQRGI